MQTFRAASSGSGRRATQIIRAAFRLHSTYLVRQRESTTSNPHGAGPSPRADNLRHAAAGTAWVLSFAYLLAEVFTAAAWSTPYSFAHDSISSLGVTTCEVGSCSPMHDVMNSTFVALGVLTLLGALFLHRHIRSGREKKWILSLAVIIAVSTAATGLFPANDGTIIHWSAVLPGFVARHVVLVLIAWHMWHEKRLVALWSALCALVGVVGAGLMLGQALHFGLGERLALYPLPMWMAVTGMAVLMGLARRTVLRNVEFSLRTFHPRTATPRPGKVRGCGTSVLDRMAANPSLPGPRLVPASRRR